MLQSTGERLLPWDTQHPPNHYEHLQRYYFAAELAAGKKVLDLGSGEGYGSNILAAVADEVIGLEIDQQSVDWAAQKYQRPNLRFVQGSGTTIPMAGGSFDLVVCFEMLEHIADQETLLREIKRILKPEGLLVMSTPDRAVYSDEPNYHNPFHVRELYAHEFQRLIETELPHALYLGQRAHMASAMWPATAGHAEAVTEIVVEKHAEGFVSVDSNRKAPMYFVVVASAQALPRSVCDAASRYRLVLDISDAFTKRLHESYSEHIAGLMAAERARFDQAQAEAGARINEVQADAKTCIEQVKAESAAEIDRIETAANAQMARFAARLGATDRRVRAPDTLVAEQREQIASYAGTVLLLNSKLTAIHSSRLWKIAGTLQQLRSDVLLGIHLIPRMLRWTISRQAPQKLKLFWCARTSGLFDECFYGARNADVAASHIPPLVHYVSRGAAEGRDPHPLFDSDFYLRNNPDVANSGINPLLHYVRRGAAEGRDPHPLFDTSFYLENNPDVAQSGLNPLAHYVRYGAAERRRPHPAFTGALQELARQPQARPQPATRDAASRSAPTCERTTPGPAGLIGGYDVPQGKELWDAYGKARLEELLIGHRTLSFPLFDQPLVSIVLVLYNKAHLSLLSLESLLRNADVPFEVIIVDNDSRDETAGLLKRVNGAKVLRNSANAGFGQACMQAVEKATAEYLFFFNNDALLEPKAISRALKVFQEKPSAGAVGGKILLADGALQEAGSILWSDGSALGYGRGDNAHLPQYEFRRSVDFCSGAFLFTPRALFTRLGGFDACFSPAYYEDVDYCLRVWAEGLEVVYEPRAVIRHYESASSGNSESARDLMIAHQKKLVARWGQALSKHLSPHERNIAAARFAAQAEGLRVLVIDDRVPHYSLGSGYPRSNEVLSQLLALGCRVTCSTFTFPLQEIEREYEDVPREIELFDGLNHRDRLYRDYLPNVDVIWVSRPHNFASFLDLAMQLGAGQAKIVYDAEAIAAERERAYAQLCHLELPEPLLHGRVKRELALAHAADAAVVVSQSDLESMRADNLSNVHLLGHCVDPVPTPSAFAERRTFLFVGAVHAPNTPNADSMRYFCEQIWPEVRALTGAELEIAGHGTNVFLSDLQADGINILGPIDDLSPLYNHARVMVVPTRYAAGIPLKVLEAAAHGLPVVLSNLARKQLRWQDGEECLSANTSTEFAQACVRLFSDAATWNHIRDRALLRVRSELSREKFRAQLSRILVSVLRDGTSSAAIDVNDPSASIAGGGS